MNNKKPIDVLNALISSYYYKRDIIAILQCVSDNIEWIGSEEIDYASGKQELEALLLKDFDIYPDAFGIEIINIKEQIINESTVFYTVQAIQKDIPGIVSTLTIRGSVTCVKNDNGWIISNVHTSTPNKSIYASLYKDAIDGAPVGIYVGQRENRNSIYANKACIELGNYNKDVKAPGKNLVTFMKCNNKEPLLSQEDINNLNNKEYKTFFLKRNNQYLNVKAKAIKWNDKDAYITYIMDKTVEHNHEIEMQKLIDEVPGGIGIYEIKNHQAYLIYLNQAYYRMIGIERNDRLEYLNDAHINAVYQDDKQKLLNLINDIEKGLNNATILYRLIVGNHYKWIQLTINVIERLINKITVYASFSDCDQLIKTKKEAKEIKKRENALISSIPGGLAIYRLKKDGSINTEYVSKSLAKMCGYNTQEFLELLKDNALSNVLSSDIDYLKEEVISSVKNHTPINCTYHIHTKNQGAILIRLDANYIDSDLKDDDIALWYAVHTKVSDQAKRTLLEQKRYRTVLENLDIAFLEWEKDSGFYCSDNFKKYSLSNYRYDLILHNKADLSLIHPDDHDKYFNFCKECKLKKSNIYATMRLKLVDDTYKWTELQIFNEYDSDGNPIRIFGILRDMDKQWVAKEHKLQEALFKANEANKAKTDFLSRISHDMRTPLNGILGLTALIKDETTDCRIIKDLTQLELSGSYLLNLINDTLDVSKIESGLIELKPTVCDGREIFNNVVSLIKPNIKQKKINFILDVDNLPFNILYVDVGRIEQIAMNILGNAIKFTPEGGTIELSMTNISIENNIILDKMVVKDNGIGMSKEFIPKIFEPFSQENNGNTSLHNGTGLGMTICKEIIDLMGGKIEIESELNKGTTFTIYLPLPIANKEQIKEFNIKRSTNYCDIVLKGRRILLCEDHPINRDIAIRLLKKKGMKIECANNGQEGVNMFKASSLNYYDAILMDIRMPIMDGIDATKNIRALDRDDSKTIPIIAMTANALLEDIEKTKEAGMNGHISKPINIETLYNTIEQFITPSKLTSIKPKVLIVDDHEINVEVIKIAIEKDFDILVAYNVDDAITIIDAHLDLAAIITDIQMPGKNGFDLIKYVRNNYKTRKIAIIANTQYGDASQEETLLNLGADDFIYKPTTPKIVEMRLNSVLKRF